MIKAVTSVYLFKFSVKVRYTTVILNFLQIEITIIFHDITNKGEWPLRDQIVHGPAHWPQIQIKAEFVPTLLFFKQLFTQTRNTEVWIFIFITHNKNGTYGDPKPNSRKTNTVNLISLTYFQLVFIYIETNYWNTRYLDI